MESLDWSKFDSKFVKLEADKKKVLVVHAWRIGEKKFEGDVEAKPSLIFDVLSEDGRVVSKEFSTSAVTLVMKLRPIIDRASASGKAELHLAITKVGAGTGTNYTVEEL